MRDPSQLRILHISDLHCGKETRSGAVRRSVFSACWVIKASHGKVLESPNKFNALTATDRAEFLTIAKSIHRIRLLLIAVIVLWGEAMALGFMHARYTSTVERFISASLLQYL